MSKRMQIDSPEGGEAPMMAENNEDFADDPVSSFKQKIKESMLVMSKMSPEELAQLVNFWKYIQKIVKLTLNLEPREDKYQQTNIYGVLSLKGKTRTDLENDIDDDEYIRDDVKDNSADITDIFDDDWRPPPRREKHKSVTIGCQTVADSYVKQMNEDKKSWPSSARRYRDRRLKQWRQLDDSVVSMSKETMIDPDGQQSKRLYYTHSNDAYDVMELGSRGISGRSPKHGHDVSLSTNRQNKVGTGSNNKETKSTSPVLNAQQGKTGTGKQRGRPQKNIFIPQERLTERNRFEMDEIFNDQETESRVSDIGSHVNDAITMALRGEISIGSEIEIEIDEEGLIRNAIEKNIADDEIGEVVCDSDNSTASESVHDLITSALKTEGVDNFVGGTKFGDVADSRSKPGEISAGDNLDNSHDNIHNEEDSRASGDLIVNADNSNSMDCVSTPHEIVETIDHILIKEIVDSGNEKFENDKKVTVVTNEISEVIDMVVGEDGYLVRKDTLDSETTGNDDIEDDIELEDRNIVESVEANEENSEDNEEDNLPNEDNDDSDYNVEDHQEELNDDSDRDNYDFNEEDEKVKTTPSKLTHVRPGKTNNSNDDLNKLLLSSKKQSVKERPTKNDNTEVVKTPKKRGRKPKPKTDLEFVPVDHINDEFLDLDPDNDDPEFDPENIPGVEVSPKRGRGRPRRVGPPKPRRPRKKKPDTEKKKWRLTDEDIVCNICDAVCSNRAAMEIHKRRHTGSRPFCCEVCSKTFTTRGNMNRHVLTHSGLKPHKCTVCGKGFTEAKSVKIHMREHTGERPFVCPICSQDFRQAVTLKYHMDIHNNEKGHLCDHCGKGFRQKGHLELHRKKKCPL